MGLKITLTTILMLACTWTTRVQAMGPVNKITLSPGSSALVQANVDTEVACSAGGPGAGELRFCTVKNGSSSVCGFDSVCAVLHYQNGKDLIEETLTSCGDEDDPASFTACEQKLLDNPSCRPSGDRFCTVKNGSSSICGFDSVCIVISYRLGNDRKVMVVKKCGDEDQPENFTKCEQALRNHPACR